LQPLRDSLSIKYSVDGTNPVSTGKKYDKSFEVTLPATIKAIAYLNNKQAGDVAEQYIPVSFGKAVTIFPQPSEKYKARYGATLTDGISASEKYNDDNWIGFEGDNLSALVSLEGKFKISKISFSYLENGDNLIFAPHSVIIETSDDGINYKLAGVHDFDDSKWSMAAKKNELSVNFPETEATHIRLLIFNRGTCPENHPGAGKKAWIFVDEISVK
jgi:hexosaminidase